MVSNVRITHGWKQTVCRTLPADFSKQHCLSYEFLFVFLRVFGVDY